MMRAALLLLVPLGLVACRTGGRSASGKDINGCTVASKLCGECRGGGINSEGCIERFADLTGDVPFYVQNMNTCMRGKNPFPQVACGACILDSLCEDILAGACRQACGLPAPPPPPSDGCTRCSTSDACISIGLGECRDGCCFGI